MIVGGGVAGLEALAALPTFCDDRLAITLVSPNPSFGLRADAIEAAFGRAAPVAHDVATIAADHDATYLHDAVHAVHREYGLALTQAGRELPYDSLLVAVGAHATPHPALHEAVTFRGMQDVAPLSGVLADLDAGRARSVLFVVAPGTTWTLPLYELALLCAEYADERALEVAVTVATPESRPVAALGHDASVVVERSLAARGIQVRHQLLIQRLERGRLLDLRGAVLASGDRVVALPLLEGPRLRGLPHDRHGFIPVDAHGAVRGARGVHAAGDATTGPYKQGGLAAQQAVLAARAIARAAGAQIAEGAPRPTLRAHAAAGTGPSWFSTPLAPSDPRSAIVADGPLWRPPTKVAMPYLATYLEQRS